MNSLADTQAIASQPPKADELAYGLAGLPAEPTEAPKAVEPVRFLTGKKRVETYELVFPFAIGDVEYRTITVKRLNGGEVAAFSAKIRALPEDAPSPRFPMFFVGDVEISDDAWDAMDDDDRVALVEIMSDFLPARFRR